ncbi:MAG: RND transporter, partial [Fibrobacterales bacterium]|nr:RND transporter [Fibrobacterales bacterium]
MNGTKTERFARALIGRLRRFRWPFLALTLALLALSGWLAATKIRINSDLSSLLPKDTPSVLALQEVNRRFGASDKFMLVIQSDSALLVADLQDSLKRVLDAEWKDILVSAQIDQP